MTSSQIIYGGRGSRYGRRYGECETFRSVIPNLYESEAARHPGLGLRKRVIGVGTKGGGLPSLHQQSEANACKNVYDIKLSVSACFMTEGLQALHISPSYPLLLCQRHKLLNFRLLLPVAKVIVQVNALEIGEPIDDRF